MTELFVKAQNKNRNKIDKKQKQKQNGGIGTRESEI